MKLSILEKGLIKAMEEFEIIDSHEHLPAEEERIKKEVDIFTLFSQYTRRDLALAGMSEEDYERLFDHKLSLEQRWRLFAPYWKEIRWGSYARAALLTAKKFYGFDDINEKTYKPLSEGIKKANKIGIYEKILRKACKIRTALTQNITPAQKTPLLTPVIRMPFMAGMNNWKDISHPSFAPQADVHSVNDYLNLAYEYILNAKKEGAVGLKMISNPYGTPAYEAAVNAFNNLRNNKESSLAKPNPLQDYSK